MGSPGGVRGYRLHRGSGQSFRLPVVSKNSLNPLDLLHFLVNLVELFSGFGGFSSEFKWI